MLPSSHQYCHYLLSGENTLTRRLTVLALTFMASVMSISTFASEDEAAGPSLYERLGSMEGIAQIVDDTIALHHGNFAFL